MKPTAIMTRRNFLKSSTVLTVVSPFIILGADSSARRYRTALIGCGWWGNNILGEAMASGACQIIGLCDVDQRQIDSTLEHVTKGSGDQPKQYKDFRELLEKEK